MAHIHEKPRFGTCAFTHKCDLSQCDRLNGDKCPWSKVWLTQKNMKTDKYYSERKRFAYTRNLLPQITYPNVLRTVGRGSTWICYRRKIP